MHVNIVTTVKSMPMQATTVKTRVKWNKPVEASNSQQLIITCPHHTTATTSLQAVTNLFHTAITCQHSVTYHRYLLIHRFYALSKYIKENTEKSYSQTLAAQKSVVHIFVSSHLYTT